MPRIFRLSGSSASPAPASFFASIQGMRKIVEENLPTLLGLTYLESNWTLLDLPASTPREAREIDTLAFDTHTYSPVAIEYRERITPETASQGIAIMGAAPSQAQIVKYLVKRAGFSPDRIDWSKMRVLFMAREVVAPPTISSRSTRGGIEMWEVSLYDGDVLVLDHTATFPSTESAPKLSRSADVAEPAEDLSL
jgi:hypothetical protein